MYSKEKWNNGSVRKKRMLEPRDSAFINADEVHASFNISPENARILAILGPCVGEVGYEVVEVGEEEGWRDLRD